MKSRIITVNGKRYDPTLRMLLVMWSDGLRMTIDCLDGFWKIPPLSLDDNGWLTDKHVSKHRPDLAQLTPDDLRIQSHDMHHLRNVFRNIFSHAYPRMLLS